MRRIKIGNIPEVFHEIIKKPNHKYPQGVHTFIMMKNQDNIKSIKKNFQEISRLSIEIILQILWVSIRLHHINMTF